MCGIVGLINKTSNTSNKVLKDMLKTLHHRGPDDEDIFYEQKDSFTIGLGHKRLSIQDLSFHGHQPMYSDCNRYIIVYNGEIYNFKDIRKELEKFNYKFKSNSDTEVILYAYKEWGLNAINRFIGMFAISIYDKIKNQLILIRDRLGVKPLNYYIDNDVFLFSSELKSFHKHPIFKKNKIIDKEALSLYFQFGYINAPKTIFKNTFKLEPGKYLIYDLNTHTIDIKTYWDVKDYFQQPKKNIREEEAIEYIEKLLIDAYKLRMVSDVEVGVFLSGGYDSVSVASILSKHTNKKIKTFTIGFDEKKYNEAIYAKEIAKYLGTEHKELYITEDNLLEILPNLTEIYDEPFGDSSSIPTIVVSKLAKQDVKVVLSGDGGDEIFFGYGKYVNSLKLKKIFDTNKILKENISRMILVKLINTFKINYKVGRVNKFISTLKDPSISNILLNSKRCIEFEEHKKIIKDNKYLNYFFKDEFSYINNMQYIDFKTYLPDDILQKVDRASMSVSIEAREPMLDHRIVEYVVTLPNELLYKDNIQKYLLKQIVHKYVPKELMERNKQGFSIPIDKWLNGKLKDEVYFYLDFNRIKKEGLLNPDEVIFLRDSYYAKKGVNPYKIWFLLVFEKWYERWMKYE